MKKTKRVVTLLLALTLSLSTVVFTFASESVSTGSGSVSTGSDSPSTNTTTDVSVGKIVVNGVEKGSIKLTNPTEAVMTIAHNTDKIISLLGSKYVAGATAKVVGAQELNATGLTPDDFAAGVTVTFNVSTVKAGDTIEVLHETSTDVWEVLNPIVADGTVTATFHSFSPVLFVKLTGGNVLPSADTTAEANSTSTTSPKTGLNGVIYFVELVAVLSLAGIAVITRKKSISK